jgi:phosphomannomutase/phosphoglucomutase
MSTQKIEKRLFGTNGVRGVVGESMTPDLVLKIGMALASMRPGRIAVGRDTRTSGPALASAVKAGILACGSDVIDMGVLPTPALQYLVRNHFDAGAMITASHNPPQYNGVKIIEADGTEMSDEETVLLEDRIFSGTFDTCSWDGVGTETDEPWRSREYVDAVAGAVPPGAGAGMTVVVDPGSGPAAATTPAILRRLGCRVYTINAQMDGTFPGRMPEPSPEGLAPLAEMVRETRADFGVAHDGDADRSVFIDDRGVYLEENEEFALMQQHICRQKPGVVVTPVSTTRLVEAVARETGCTVEYTPVGSIYVARTMRKLEDAGMPVVFGGEGNGGLIFPDHQYCRDGGMTAAAMVALLAGAGEPLSRLRERLPPRYMVKEKIHAPDPGALLGQVRMIFRDESLDLTDGVRINRRDSWALLRPSGTEPFMRLYVEADDRETAERFSAEITGALAKSGRV